ncbi:MAG: YHS domain-containing (seleno)protein [Planctomycetota bacterium]
MSRRTLLLALVCITLGGCAGPGHPAAAAPAPFNVDEAGLGLHGYDPVTYFPEGGGVPRVGSSDITSHHQGVTYRFVGLANRDRFHANPERYVPLYGGWSAWGMVDGQQMDIDPTSFLVEDGHLLLFYFGTFSDGRSKWLQRDTKELRARADRAWSTLRSRGD